MHPDNTLRGTQYPEDPFMRRLCAICAKIANLYHVEIDDAQSFLIYSAPGNDILVSYLKEKYNVDATRWEWSGYDSRIAFGLEFKENAEFTKC